MTATRQHRSIPLTEVQRKTLAEIAPELAARLRLDERNPRSIRFTLDDLNEVKEKAERAIVQGITGTKQHSLRCVIESCSLAIRHSQSTRAIPASERVHQFKITLRDSQPSIWRRIQVKDCTLDKLHERIQTAMGWTNSHLNHFKIGDQLYGDPLLMEMLDATEATKSMQKGLPNWKKSLQG